MPDRPLLHEKGREALIGGRIKVAFALVVSLLLFSAAISYYNTYQLFNSARELLQNYQIEGALGNVLSTMKDAETGSRGYVITGNKDFLDPYRRAVAQIDSQTQRLEELVADRPAYGLSFQEVKKKIDARLAIARRSIQLREENGFEAAQKDVARGDGKKVMDEIRVLIEAMGATGQVALENRAGQDRSKYSIAVIAGIVTTILSLGLVGLAFDLVRRELVLRRRSADVLREERERFRVTLASIGDAVIVTDAAGIITFLNPVAGSLTGWETEAIGQPLSDVFRIVAEGTNEPVESPVTRVLREGTVVGLANHTELICRNGAVCPIDDSGAPVRDRYGHIEGVVLVFRDITDRRRAAKELEASEARYRMLFATAQDAILILDGTTGRITDANPFVCDLLGYAHDELMGMELWQLSPAEHADASRAALRQLQERGSMRHDHLPLQTKHGKLVDVEFVSNIYAIDNQKIIQCNIRDISQRRRAEETLRVASDRYRSVVDHIIHGIITVDEGGIIESVNPAAERLFGYAAGEIVGQNAKVLMPNANLGEHDDYLGNYLRTGDAKVIGIGREVVGRRKGGSAFPIDLAVSSFRFDGRRLFTGIIRDITERKQLEAELRQRAEQLTDADRRKNEFLAMLAHELRNPLAPISNAVHLLRHKCPKNEDTSWAQDVIERQVQHMARMVDDLLDVSRITRGKINIQKEPIDVAAAIARAVEMVQPLIDTRKHHLVVSVPAEALRVEADLQRLAQALANLLNNAAKFTEDGGRIWLSAEPSENEVLIKVRDTGVGIPANYLPRIFDLFSQEDSSLDRTHGGLGIGLTLVRLLITMHGGSVRASSAGAGQGSEFTISLPRLAGIAPVLAPAPAAPEPAAVPGARRILVVDDNVDGARSLSILLKAMGHDVRTAHEGMAALNIAREWKPEVVLLDIGLPQMNGLEVARRMREEPDLRDALLVAMTGYGQDHDRQRSQQAGFDSHLVKPLDLGILQTLLLRSRSDVAGQD